MKKVKLSLSKTNKPTEETYQQTSVDKYIPANINSSTSDKMNFLDSLAKDTKKDSFINILVKEALKANQMNNYKKKVSEINLMENNIEGYEWNSLLNNSRPLSHYTRINNKKTELEDNDIKNNLEFKSPKILVDLPNDKMQLFFGKNSFGNSNNTSKYRNKSKKEKDNDNNIPNFRKNNSNTKNKKNVIRNKRKSTKLPTWHFPYKFKKNKNIELNIEESKIEINNYSRHIQPTSIYENYGPNNAFYFSNTFSDYYKEDLKSFAKKMPVLKAKIKTNARRLKTEIRKEKTLSNMKEQILYDLIKKDDLILRKQDLIISAKRRNPVPLMKYIYKQEYPNAVEIKENIRKYFKTMKPYGNDDGKVDYTKNDRWRLNKELIKFRKMEYNLNKNNKGKKIFLENDKNKLVLNYYDINDPDLQIFNKLNLESIDNDNNKKNHSFEYKNHFGNLYDNEAEEKIRAKTIENEKQRPKSSYKSSKGYNILNSENNKYKNRPHSSNINRNKYLEDRYFFDIKDYNELYKDYLPSNRFPVKTSSKINNSSYNKINELIKERFYKKKVNDNYFITEPDIKVETKVKNRKYNNINENKNLYLDSYYGNRNKNKINKGTRTRPNTAIGLRKQKCNVLDFNKYIDIKLDLKMNKINDEVYLSPMNFFNKLAGKYYSSSNNVHIKNKRNKRKEILDTKNVNNK